MSSPIHQTHSPTSLAPSSSSTLKASAQDLDTAFWTVYNEQSDITDTEQVETWNRTLDVLLIFAGLFSAINTAFVLEAYQQIQPDPAQTSAATLALLLIYRNNNTVTFTQEKIAELTQEYTTNAVLVTCIFFASLALSLIAAFGSVAAKGWIAIYSTKGRGSLRQLGVERQHRYNSMKIWKFESLMGLLPLFSIHLAVVMTFLIIFVGAALLYSTAIAIGALYPSSPFQTRVTRYISPIMKRYQPTLEAWYGTIQRLYTSFRGALPKVVGDEEHQGHAPEPSGGDAFKVLLDEMKWAEMEGTAWEEVLEKSPELLQEDSRSLRDLQLLPSCIAWTLCHADPHVVNAGLLAMLQLPEDVLESMLRRSDAAIDIQDEELVRPDAIDVLQTDQPVNYARLVVRHVSNILHPRSPESEEWSRLHATNANTFVWAVAFNRIWMRKDSFPPEIRKALHYITATYIPPTPLNGCFTKGTDEDEITTRALCLLFHFNREFHGQHVWALIDGLKNVNPDTCLSLELPLPGRTHDASDRSTILRIEPYSYLLCAAVRHAEQHPGPLVMSGDILRSIGEGLASASNISQEVLSRAALAVTTCAWRLAPAERRKMHWIYTERDTAEHRDRAIENKIEMGMKTFSVQDQCADNISFAVLPVDLWEGVIPNSLFINLLGHFEGDLASWCAGGVYRLLGNIMTRTVLKPGPFSRDLYIMLKHVASYQAKVTYINAATQKLAGMWLTSKGEDPLDPGSEVFVAVLLEYGVARADFEGLKATISEASYERISLLCDALYARVDPARQTKRGASTTLLSRLAMSPKATFGALSALVTDPNPSPSMTMFCLELLLRALIWPVGQDGYLSRASAFLGLFLQTITQPLSTTYFEPNPSLLSALQFFVLESPALTRVFRTSGSTIAHSRLMATVLLYLWDWAPRAESLGVLSKDWEPETFFKTGMVRCMVPLLGHTDGEAPDSYRDELLTQVRPVWDGYLAAFRKKGKTPEEMYTVRGGISGSSGTPSTEEIFRAAQQIPSLESLLRRMGFRNGGVVPEEPNVRVDTPFQHGSNGDGDEVGNGVTDEDSDDEDDEDDLLRRVLSLPDEEDEPEEVENPLGFGLDSKEYADALRAQEMHEMFNQMLHETYLRQRIM